MRHPLLMCSLLASSTPAVAGVRVVAPTGAPYAEIQAAVDAAEDGDVVLVKTGTYASFVIRNQEVAVIADAGHVVNVDGAIRVAGVGATRSVLLSGLRAIGRASASPATKHGLFARNCAGSLRVVQCELEGRELGSGSNPQCYEGQGAWIEGCPDVAFVGCTLRGSSALEIPAPTGGTGVQPLAGSTDGGHGLYAVASQLALFDSTARGGRSGFGYASCAPPPVGYDGFGEAGEGCRANGAFVFASACTFTGAAGWNTACLGLCGCIYASHGGNGLVMDAAPGPAHVLASTMTPGPGGTHPSYPLPLPCLCGIGGNFCHPHAPAPSGFPSQGPVNPLSGSARRLTGSTLVREGALATLTFHGQPGDRIELLLAERTGFQFLPAARGVLLVRRSRPQLVQQVGTIGPSGVLTQTWTVGELGAGSESRTLYLQAAMIDGAGQTTLSSPAVIILLDSAL